MIKRYSELIQHMTFADRYEYLRLFGTVAHTTFGFERYLNQSFYKSHEWKTVRTHVIARDLGCDLGLEGYDIADKLLIHHMNPITPEDITSGSNDIVDPEYLITVSHTTHNAIHYGESNLKTLQYTERRPGDTRLW